MKTLLLLRHAKSSWGNPDLPDHDRALNKRGQRAAPVMGTWIKQNDLVPGAAYVSDARRTVETWDRLGLDLTPTITGALYHATPQALLDTIMGATADIVLLVGHNPGIGLLAEAIVETEPTHDRFDHYPTAALLVARFDIASWGDLALHTGRDVQFITPHDLA